MLVILLCNLMCVKWDFIAIMVCLANLSH